MVVVRDAVGGKQLDARWGMCQLGTSAAFVREEDVERGENLALFGAPGCFTWRGNVFVQNVGSVKR